MVFFESKIFSEIIRELMSDDIYADLQAAIIKNPKIGDLIQGTGGLRKVRWYVPSTGKRGGARIIYYYISRDDQIFMLFAYSKSKKQNLTEQQKKILKAIVTEELHNGQKTI